MTFNDAGLNIIKQYESCELEAYQDTRGIWTIGYGHTSRVSQGMTITAEQAVDYLKMDVNYNSRIVQNLVVPLNLNDNQFSACVSFAFNVGTGRFSQSSILKNIKDKNFTAAARAFLLYEYAGGKPLLGLEKRRASEMELFLTPVA